MTVKETETLDKLYLEWAQFTHARTYREVIFEHTIRECLASDRITEWTRDRLQTALDAALGDEG